MKIGYDVSIFRDDEPASQHIAEFGFALNDDDGRRYTFCDLGSGERHLPKYDGQQRGQKARQDGSP